ncbi:MAG: FAD-binding oxidoreductase [Gammaproteobacteria bacterium]
MKLTTLCEQLTQLLPEGKIKTDPQALQAYGTDWTSQYVPNPAVIVFPKTIQELQQITLFANQHRLPLVPSGGRTGLSGGAVACNQEIVVSFDLMNQISEVNLCEATIKCQAGVVTQQLQEAAAAHNLYYPVDFASSGSSQIGGNIATNAGGIKVIHYGHTRQWVAGLTVVTGKGDILELNKGLVKNATGYDLRHLFIGSEGTLGFIADATIRLTRSPLNPTVLVLGLNAIAPMLDVLQCFRQQLDLTACEFFSNDALQLVMRKHKVAAPLNEAAPFYMLLEFDALSETVIELALQLFEECLNQQWITDGVMSQNASQAASLWQLRELLPESLSEFTPYKNDISVLTMHIPNLVTDLNQIITQHYADFDIIWFGHIGDGNMHLNILKPSGMERSTFTNICEQVNEQIFATIAKYDGSISAEHGIGLLKKKYLHYTRSAEQVAYLRAIKQVFDPNGIMNPGKIFD